MPIDEYVAKIDAALDDCPNAMDKGALVKEIVAVFVPDIPSIKLGLDRYKGRATSIDSKDAFDDGGDLRALRGKLQRKKEIDQEKDLADPFRIGIKEVDGDIAQCDSYLFNGNVSAAKEFVEQLVFTYGRDISNISLGLPCFDLHEAGKTSIDDLKYIKKHLVHYRSHLAERMGEAKSKSLNVTNTASSTSQATANVDVFQVAEQLQRMPADTLSNEEKDELKSIFFDMEAQRGKPKGQAKGSLQKVLGWLSDKGVDIAIALLPYIVNWASTLH